MMEMDHIAISGVTLEDAVAHVEDALGVALQPGGKHDVFGTHNKLLGLEDGLYLEAISTDPDALVPLRSRWFDLDRVSGPPRVSNWICRTDDLTGLLPALPDGAGRPVALTRGQLSWDMAVPEDGVLPFDNMHPALIQWKAGGHPAEMLAPSGCRLLRLVIGHPEADTLRSVLAPELTDDRIVFDTQSAPGLTAEFDTPHGARVLR